MAKAKKTGVNLGELRAFLRFDVKFKSNWVWVSAGTVLTEFFLSGPAQI